MEFWVLVGGLGAVFLGIVVAVIALTAPAPTAGLSPGDPLTGAYPPGTAPPDSESLRVRAISPAARRIAAIGRALTPGGAGAWLQRRLEYAGNPAGWLPERVMEMQGIGLFVGGLLGGLLARLLGLGLSGVVGAVLVMAFAGFWLPFLLVYNLGTRRQDEIRRDLPDALDLLTLSVEAGLGFDAALAQVATSMPGPLAREFTRMLQEIQMGQRRADGLRGLAARTTIPELRTLATSLVQAADLGIPIATVLREQAHQMRLRRRQYAEEQARKLPVKIVIPLVLCIFPALFIVIVGPGIIRIFDTLFIL
ncbi:MAG TPA: type II secretion system F family protein [Micromonosporaceae bacterium]|nr:type II secretion system F family protein [Micromonosporaceae bacterium]